MKWTYGIKFNDVVCDVCGANYTHRDDAGGFLLLNTAVCPECDDKVMQQVYDHGDEGLIMYVNDNTTPFADFVRRRR